MLEELVQSARCGNRAAAVQLVESLYRPIYAFLRRLSGSEPDAADLTQKTFARAWQALGTFRGGSSASSWLHAIAYHVYVDWRRADGRTESRSDEWWAGCPTPSFGPDEILARTDLARVLYLAVEQLPGELRETVHLHYYQELTLEETAAAMEVATSTVKYRLRQALAELQKQLVPERRLSSTSASPRIS